MKKYCLWKDEEVKKLFSHIEDCTKKGICLTTAFKIYAESNKRKPNSVRNYYYAELSHLEENSQRRQNLGIDISLHQKTMPKYFSQDETNQQITQILKLYHQGYSIRKACLKIANGNIDQMVRLQNKYRTVLKKQPEIIQNIEKNLENVGIEIKKLPTNIISMPSRKTNLSESDINSLFMGLVKLIKNQAKQEYSTLSQKQHELANNSLRQMMLSISEKEKQIESLRKSFELLKNENQAYEQKILDLRTENANLRKLSSNQKMKNLKKFARSLEKSQNTKTNI